VTGSNIRRLASALEELEATLPGVEAKAAEISPTDAERLGEVDIVPPLVTRHGEVHVLNRVRGAAPFAELRARAVVVELQGVAIPIAGLNDLIRIKRAVGRPRDLDDIAELARQDRRPPPAVH
jgi:hypothetical protein